MDESSRSIRSLADCTAVTADELRGRAPARAAQPAVATCRAVCVASGKGGTGKSCFTTNLGVLLAQAGRRVVLLDADMGLANAHILMGLTPLDDVATVVEGKRSLEDILLEGAHGLQLIPGGSGSGWLAELTPGQLSHLATELGRVTADADLLLVDLAAGIGSQVMRFLSAAHEVVVVTTPDVTALMDAYATIKCIAADRPGAAVRLVVNRARDHAEAALAFHKVERVAQRQGIAVRLERLGWLPQHWCVQRAILRREPFVCAHPRSAITERLRGIAARIIEEQRGWRTRAEADGLKPFAQALGGSVFSGGTAWR